MKRITLLILFFLCLSMIVMGVALMMSGNNVNAHGGFRRTYIDSPILSADTIDLTFDSYYISGKTDHTLFLGNYAAPRHVVSVNILTGDTTHIALTVDNPLKIALGDVKCRIDSPNVFLYDGTAPVIFQGHLSERIVRQCHIAIPYFLDMEPMGKDRFAFRSLGAEGVAKLAYADGKQIVVKGILTKQVDGVFCTTGIMTYDHALNELVYVHFYRNEIIIMDSCLRVTKTMHTIDTIHRAKLSVGSTSNGSMSVFSSPPVVVNRQSSVFHQNLLINSKILADNDNAAALKHGSNFDLYDLKSDERNGHYLCTVHIPHFQNEEATFHRLFDFEFEDRIAILYPRHLVIYHLKDITCKQELAEHLKKIVGAYF